MFSYFLGLYRTRKQSFLVRGLRPIFVQPPDRKQVFVSCLYSAVLSFSKFSGICVFVIYCLIINVLCCLATAYLDYHSFFALSTTFFIFLQVLFLVRCFPRKHFIILPRFLFSCQYKDSKI